MTPTVDYELLQRILDEQGHIIAMVTNGSAVPNMGDVIQHGEDGGVRVLGVPIAGDVVCVGRATCVEWVEQHRVYFPDYSQLILDGIYVKLVAE